MKKKVVVYAHQASGMKHGMQKLHELGEYLGSCTVKEGFELIGVITEISDKHLYERSGFIRCIELISSNEVEGIYVLDASNISENKQEVIDFVQSVVETGAFIKSVKNNLSGEKGYMFYDDNTIVNNEEPSEFVLFYRF